MVESEEQVPVSIQNMSMAVFRPKSSESYQIPEKGGEYLLVDKVTGSFLRATYADGSFSREQYAETTKYLKNVGNVCEGDKHLSMANCSLGDSLRKRIST